MLSLDPLRSPALHVLPEGEWAEHRYSPQCGCHPSLRDGVWIHHALDGREDDADEAEFLTHCWLSARYPSRKDN